MEAAVIAAIVTSAIAVIVAIYNSYATFTVSKRTSYVNTVTSERVKWLGKLRENLSDYISRVYELRQTLSSTVATYGSTERQRKLIELKKVQIMLKLQLNPNDPNDQLVSGKIDEIFSIVEANSSSGLQENMEQLVTATQAMLKAEWEKVKKESREGQLFDDLDKA